mgnify:CR=1 FL=1
MATRIQRGLGSTMQFQGNPKRQASRSRTLRVIHRHHRNSHPAERPARVLWQATLQFMVQVGLYQEGQAQGHL